jgi:hypothetical protein
MDTGRSWRQFGYGGWLKRRHGENTLVGLETIVSSRLDGLASGTPGMGKRAKLLTSIEFVEKHAKAGTSRGKHDGSSRDVTAGGNLERLGE